MSPTPPLPALVEGIIVIKPLPALAGGIIVIKPPQLPLPQLQPRSLPAPHVPPTPLLLSDSLPLPSKLPLLCQLTLQAALVFIKEIIVILLEVNTKSNVNPITIDIYT